MSLDQHRRRRRLISPSASSFIAKSATSNQFSRPGARSTFDPAYAEAWNNMGAAYDKLGRYEGAAAACEQALLYKPDFESARTNLQYARAKLKTSRR
jgi:tetratricopeptide (TPR) repeat protein